MLQKHFGRSLIDLNLLHFLMVTIKTTNNHKIINQNNRNQIDIEFIYLNVNLSLNKAFSSIVRDAIKNITI
jgi:hypothetical protein